MTFREKYKADHGYDIVVECKKNGIYPCPSKYGYERKNPSICRRLLDCKSCWEREMEDDVAKAPKELLMAIKKADDEAKHDLVNHHAVICKELNELYARKNHDYGNSFHSSYEEDGLLMAKIRIGDKYNRFKSLIKSDQKVAGESIRDTLVDMANYCIMTVMELDGDKK